MKDLRQTEEYAKYMENIGWTVERKDGANYFIKRIPIIGSAIKLQRPKQFNNLTIEQLTHKYRAFQIIVEPENLTYHQQLTTYNFKLNKSPSLPSKTIHIDLTKSEKQLLKDMHYKTRYNIRKIQNSQPKAGRPLDEKFRIKNSKDIDSFAEFWQKCALKQRGMFLNLKKEIIEIYKTFGKNADLILALHSNELVAGILFLHTGEISYYMYAASSKLGKKLFAPTLIAWEAIKRSKKRGSKIFDFEGIYDERFPLKSWVGFTRFKKSFGGKVVEYPGAFVKSRFPF